MIFFFAKTWAYRHWKTECEKCSQLEKKLAETTKKANNAQNFMNSIAKMLCLGSLESDSAKRNNALTIACQMLLNSSPKRKRRRSQAKNSPTKENVLAPFTEIMDKGDEDCGAVGGGVVPDTVTRSPLKPITNVASAITPSKKNIQKIQSSTRLSSRINLPIHLTTSVKKNPSADCVDYPMENEVITNSPTDIKKGLSFNIYLENFGLHKRVNNNSERSKDTTMDATLLEYVKDSRKELDKIWFDDESDDGTVEQKLKNISTPVSKEDPKTSPMSQIIEGTPLWEGNNTNEKRKRADFWLLKEKSELSVRSKSLDGRKLRQTKLELGMKQKTVDISKLAGFNGGVLQHQQKLTAENDEDIIPGSPNSQIFGGNPTSSSANINTLDTADFRPSAFSIQRSVVNNKNLETNRPSSSSGKPREFVYKRDAVRKKSERAKLAGWDCYKCAKYYNALGFSPSKVKERMNSCSRHRDNFKPKLNETPPGFWNPLFPDTQECREKGMYVSVYCPKSDT